MRIYYFVHTVGRDAGNSGIPRVSRNLGRVLAGMPDVELVPVRWDEATSSIVHAEPSFRELMQMYGGPKLRQGGPAGTAIHHDPPLKTDAPTWLLVPEVPHLGSYQDGFGPTHIAYVGGYARLHGLRIAAIFHDAMPITHFGQENSADPSALAFLLYAMALASFDVVLPVSRASSEALTGVFGRCGLEWKPQQILQAVVLPEELIGSPRLRFLNGSTWQPGSNHEFCMWGTIFPHKNQLAVMDAFNRLCRRRPDLDLVLHHFGSVDPRCVEPARIFVRRSQGRIKLHGFVGDAEMMDFIGRCRAKLFVSRAEGFGLPLAESLWLGKPCITSNRPPMTEIAAGGGAVLVDPANIDEIDEAMERVATDEAFHSRLLGELRGRSMRTWQDYGREVRNALEQADKAAAPTGERPVHFSPGQIRSDKLQIESFRFDVDGLDIGRELEERGVVVRAAGVLEYRPTGDDLSKRGKRPSIVDKPISYGPYHTVGGGELEFHLEGEVKGACRVLITSEEGRNIHHDMKTASFSNSILVSAPKGLKQLEVVFRTTPSLTYLRLEGISLTRWHG